MTLPDLVRCSKCGDGLTQDSEEILSCTGCSAKYPLYAGIPWLYRDAASSRSQWADKWQQLEVSTGNDVEQLQEALRAPDLMISTQRRIESLIEGKRKLTVQIRSLLEPFELTKVEAATRLPRDRIPSKQHFSSYLDTIFRDWAWGEEEVGESVALLASLLDGQARNGNVLVLGGGAGRLSDELARLGQWENVVQLDINPLLTRVAALLSAGEQVSLTEIPYPPAGLKSVSVDQALRNPNSGSKAPLHFLLGDVFTPPFAADSFDVLVTPWFVDILPEDFRGLSRRLNRLLRPDGLWINFGPLSFESLPLSARYTKDEVEDALSESGMTLVSSDYRRMPYLHSPHSMHKRSEEILVFSATKKENAAAGAGFSYYPRWMSDPTRSIPLLSTWQQIHSQRVFDVEILSLIDGQASIQDIIKRLSIKYSLPADRCRNVVNRFFSTIFEKGLD